MKKIIYNLLLLNVLFIFSLRVLAQEQRYVTAEYSIPKEAMRDLRLRFGRFSKIKRFIRGTKNKLQRGR